MSTLQTTNLKHPDAAGNQVTFTSGGDVNFDNGAVYLDSTNNRLGIGTTVPDALLTGKASSGKIARFRTADTDFFGIDIGTNGSNYAFIESVKGGTGSYQPLAFFVGGSRAVDIDTSGRLLVGTTTQGYAGAETLTIGNSSNAGITIRTGTGSNGSLAFSDGTAGVDEYRGLIQYRHADNSMNFFSDGTEHAKLLSNGTFRASTSTSLSTRFSGNIYHLNHNHNNGNTCSIFEHSGATSPYGIYIQFSQAGPDNNTQYFISAEDANAHRF